MFKQTYKNISEIQAKICKIQAENSSVKKQNIWENTIKKYEKQLFLNSHTEYNP